MRIVVDRDKCTGLGMCEAEAPNVFEVDDSGSLLVLHDILNEDSRIALQAAVEACPTGALTIVAS